jgi:hypothetical protein
MRSPAAPGFFLAGRLRQSACVKQFLGIPILSDAVLPQARL